MCEGWLIAKACWEPSALVSAITAAFGLAGLAVGLWQYQNAQTWKRREFVASEVEKLIQSPLSRNALFMLDYTSRRLKLHPDAIDEAKRSVRVTRGMVAAMLIPHDVADRPNYGAHGAAIRDCFDDLFTRLDNLQAMVEAKLITASDVNVYLRYWLQSLVSPKSSDGKLHKLELLLHRNMWLFIDMYGYKGVRTLCKSVGLTFHSTDHDLADLKAECKGGEWTSHVETIRDQMKKDYGGSQISVTANFGDKISVTVHSIT